MEKLTSPLINGKSYEILIVKRKYSNEHTIVVKDGNQVLTLKDISNLPQLKEWYETLPVLINLIE